MTIKSGVGQNTSSTAAGTVSVTDSAIGGSNPVAAIVVGNIAATIASGLAAAAPGGMSIGFFDGTNSVCRGWRSRNGVASSDTREVGNTTSVLTLIRSTATTNLEHQLTAAFATDGLTLTKAAVQNGAANVMAALFGGTEMHAQAGTVSANNAIAGTANITLPWVPSIGFFLVGNGAFDGTVRNGTKLSLAVVTGTGNQNCITFANSHAVLPTANTMQVETGIIGRDIAGTQTHSITAWGTTVTLATNTATGVRVYGYLFLKADTGSVYAGIKTIPSATGSVPHAVGFTSQIAGMLATLMQATGAPATDADTNALAIGLLTGTVEHSMSFLDADNQVATSSTNSVYADKSLRMESASGTDAAKATRTAMASPTLNWTTAPGTADRQMIMWAIEAEATGKTLAQSASEFDLTCLI